MRGSSITPPLRGSRREGEARLRAGGGPTRRPEGMPTRERGRPARTFARHSVGRLRHLDRPATGPCLSFGLANAVHAGRVAACRQRCADAPPPPARNKDAGGTPAFPGGAQPAVKPVGGQRGVPLAPPAVDPERGQLRAPQVSVGGAHARITTSAPVPPRPDLPHAHRQHRQDVADNHAPGGGAVALGYQVDQSQLGDQGGRHQQ